MARPSSRTRITLFEFMALIAGLSLGLWIAVPEFRAQGTIRSSDPWVALVGFALGGMSAVGPPLLIWERRRRRATWGAGRVAWFTQGMAAWLLWPPIVNVRGRQGNIGNSMSAVCYLYGTPLMAIYLAAALALGGWLRPRRRRAMMRSWRERFGLGLALAWACLGLYILSLIYREDFRR